LYNFILKKGVPGFDAKKKMFSKSSSLPFPIIIPITPSIIF
jgi:hypothetical protein